MSEVIVFSSLDLLREIYRFVDDPKTCGSHRRVSKVFRAIINQLENWERFLKNESPKTKNYVNVLWSKYYYEHANRKKSVKLALDKLDKNQFMDISEYHTLISEAINAQPFIIAPGPNEKYHYAAHFFNSFASIKIEALTLTKTQTGKIFSGLSKLKKSKLEKEKQIEVKFNQGLCWQFGIGTQHSPYKAMQCYKQISKHSPEHFAAFLIQSVQAFIKASGETFDLFFSKNKKCTSCYPYAHLDLVVQYGTSVHALFISMMYEKGVPGFYAADPKEAFQYCVLAAKNAKGHPDLKFIQHYLGRLYQKGLGTEENLPEALNCFLDAANHGVPIAQFQVWELYQKQGNHQQASVYFKAWSTIRKVQGLQ